MVPELATERLLLRGARRDDFEAFASIVMDPTRSVPPVDRRMAWRMLNATMGAWIVDGVGQWALEERATGSFVGIAGALHREPVSGPNDDGDVELAWTLVSAHRGKGFATEAMRAIVTHLTSVVRPARIIAHVDPENAASMRVAEKLGMTCVGEVPFYEMKLRRYVLGHSGSA